MSNQPNYFSSTNRSQGSANTNPYQPSYLSSGANRVLPQGQVTTSSNQGIYQMGANSQKNKEEYEIQGRKEQLEKEKDNFKWESELDNRTIYEGSSDYVHISELRDAVFELRSKYFTKDTGLSIKGIDDDEASRRFLLIEKQLEGLMRRRIDINTKDHVKGQKVLNYAVVLSDKQSEIIQLETRIRNLEARLKLSNDQKHALQIRIGELQRKIFQQQGLSGNQLNQAMRRQRELEDTKRELRNMRTTFETVMGVWNKQLRDISAKYPEDSWKIDQGILDKIQNYKLEALHFNDFAFLELRAETSNEIVQEKNTLEIIKLFAVNLKRLTDKYPKLNAELDERIQEYYSQQVIDGIDCGSLERLVELVKIVPQIVKVENVYEYSSSKTKKNEFHLRILLKALLEEVAKAKEKTGVVLDIDQGVIGMIKAQIMDIVCVDDILKVYRGAPRIQQIEIIKQKVVELNEQVPKVVPIQHTVNKIITEEVPHFIEQTVHIPVDTIKEVDRIVQKIVPEKTIEEKIVSVPTIVEKIVQLVQEKVVPYPVQTIVEKVMKELQIKVVENEKIVPQVKEVPVPIQTTKLIVEKTIEEKQVPIPTLIDKIILKPTIETKIVEVEKIIEKPVIKTEYIVAEKDKPIFKDRIKEVVIEKTKIVEVPTIITEIKQVEKRIEVPVLVRQIIEKVVEVPVPSEPVIIYQTKIKQIQKRVDVMVPIPIEQQINIVEKRVPVPYREEVIKPVELIVEKPLIEKVTVPHLIPIKCIQEKVVTKNVPQIYKEEVPVIVPKPKIVHCQTEKIVPITVTKDVIKEVPVRIDKIVNKIVEVPVVKPVEIIVEKIVPIPRIVEVIVEVPQFIDRIVEKQIIKQTVVEIPTKQQVIIPVPIPQPYDKQTHHYLNVEKPVDVVQEIPVPCIEKKQTEIPVEIIREVPVKRDVQKIVEVDRDKIVVQKVDKVDVVTLKEQKIVPIECPNPVKVVHEKPVVIQHIIPNVVYDTQIIDKPVPVPGPKQTIIKPVEITSDKIVPVVVPEIVNIKQIVVEKDVTCHDMIVEKIIPVTLPAETKVVEVDKNSQKLSILRTQHNNQVPINIEDFKPFLQEIIKPIDQQKHVVSEKINIGIENVEKLAVQYTRDQSNCVTNRIEEKIVEVRRDQQKLVPVNQREEVIVPQKVVTILKDIIAQIIGKPEPVIIPEPCPPQIIPVIQQVMVKVPQFQQKIVERIVVMPQIMQVIKHFTQICQTQNLVSGLSVDIEKQELLFRQTYGVAKRQLEIVITEMEKLKVNQPGLRGELDILVRYLHDFDKLAAIQRIIPVDREVIVEKEVPQPILVPNKDSKIIKEQLSLTLLIDKLVKEIKRIKKTNPNINLEIDNEIGNFFFSQFFNSAKIDQAGNFKQQVEKYTQGAIKNMNKLDWEIKSDQQLILSTFFQDRFTLGQIVKQANQQIESAKLAFVAIKQVLSGIENKFLPAFKDIGLKQKNLKDSFAELRKSHPQINNWTDMKSLIQSIDNLSFINVVPISIVDNIFQFSSSSDWSRVRSKQREMDLAFTTLMKIFDQKCPGNQIHNIDDFSNSDVQKYVQKLAILTQEKNFLNSEKESLTKMVNTQKEQILSLTTQLQKSNQPAQVSNDYLQKEVQRLTNHIAKMTGQKGSADREIGVLKQEKEDLQRQNQRLQAQINRLQAQTNSTKITSSNLSNSQLEQQIKNLNETIIVLTKEKGQLIPRVKILEQDLQAEKRAHEKAKGRIKELEQQLLAVKDPRSSAASQNRLVESNYSSASSNNGNPIARSSYYQGSYGSPQVESSKISSETKQTTSIIQPASYISSYKPLESTNLYQAKPSGQTSESSNYQTTTSRYATSTTNPPATYATGTTAQYTSSTIRGSDALRGSGVISQSSSVMKSSGVSGTNDKNVLNTGQSTYTFLIKKD